MLKDKAVKHTRYKEFKQNGQDTDKPPLKAVLFNNEAKLRSHAIKHFANLAEQKDWQKIKKIPYEKIAPSIDGLREIGCPFLTTDAMNPPCSANSSNCRLFDLCSTRVSFLEETFLELCNLVIQEGIAIPRTVHFKGQAGDFFWVLPNVPIVAKLARMGHLYNLMTCFRPLAASRANFTLVRENLQKSVRLQCSVDPLWDTEETWGIQPVQEHFSKPPKGGNQEASHAGKAKKNPYKRGADDWRRYLDGRDS